MIKWTDLVLYLADAMSGVREWFYLRSRADRREKFDAKLEYHIHFVNSRNLNTFMQEFDNERKIGTSKVTARKVLFY